ncbi:hypothetical protein J7438_25050 [Thalassotalea sp. G20_0]|uniref:hypothetical protein n=1 Tax=Thalassotalea sp. G20_0 TaxID=2821093 RepID=UPI001AD9F2CB|nr:hypothetical protein [Thalassotalea sp. G20_0]MBO9497325.1 hypothetical protein [Thalassotalea sp. G20_0]
MQFNQQINQLNQRQLDLKLLLKYTDFAEINWQPLAIQINSLEQEKQQLKTLQWEDLPRHEQRFKQMLNEGTIHNMAMFQNWLDHQQQTIRDKIATINRSLAAIDYSEVTYIRLVADNHRDPEINQFKIDLRNWFLFNASERYREDDSEKEFYSDAGGKSGGQKEKQQEQERLLQETISQHRAEAIS